MINANLIDNRSKISCYWGKSSMAIIDRIRSLRYLLILLVLLLCACFQRFMEIQTIATSRGIAFEVPEIEAGLKKGQIYELLDLTVMKRDCQEDCTMWFIVRDPSEKNSGNLDAARIDYGFAPGGMVVRTPTKALRSGNYSISATVQQYDASSQFVKSLSLDGMLSLHRDESGNLKVNHNALTGEK
jgi:hypothetical protein